MSVHLKLSDRNWILETMARHLATRLNYVTYDTVADPRAAVQYYLTYSTYRERVSPIEIAYFTHLEEDPEAARKFFDTAKAVDHRIVMSKIHADILKQEGIAGTKIIAPGVDLKEFDIKLRIGVVGRTYATGRKGEGLVAELMDIPEIDWFFTGSGWPGPALRLPDEQMPDFYRSLDYVLIPSRYEGGPMCAIEALACGTEVIAPRVGWMPELPHIPYENSNAQDLKRVLLGLIEDRKVKRESVLSRSWDNWADKHDQMFEKLVPGIGNKKKTKAKAVKAVAVLMTHGTEAKTLGGPSVRVPATQQALRSIGVEADVMTPSTLNCSDAPIAHVYNIWQPKTCYESILQAKAAGKKIVLSPIFMNLTNIGLFSKTVPSLYGALKGDRLDVALRELSSRLTETPNLPIQEPFEGFHDGVRACVQLADHVILLSDYEMLCLEHIQADLLDMTVIPNPVDHTRFEHANPDLFRSEYNLEEYVLCVGRIEPRKNQAMLAEAARRLQKKVVFIGHEGDPDYANVVKEVAGEYGLFIPRIDPSSPLLRSAFKGAAAFSLPSWSEGAPLAALEAAACGTPMVLSDRSSEPAYFGNLASYVNPADIDGLCDGLLNATRLPNDGQKLRDHVIEKYSWDKHAQATADVYKSLQGDKKTKRRSAPSHQELPSPKIFIDVTDELYSLSKPTGIPRVVQETTLAGFNSYNSEIVIIFWRKGTVNFEIVDKIDYLSGHAQQLINEGILIGEELQPHVLTASDSIVSMGGAWAVHADHAFALARLGRATPARLITLVHDLARWKIGHLYSENQTREFVQNLRVVCDASTELLAYSDSTKQDLAEFIAQQGLQRKRMTRIVMGAMHDKILQTNGEQDVLDRLQALAEKDYILYVATFDPRKNHRFLLDVWRRIRKIRGGKCPQLVLIGRDSATAANLMQQVNRDRDLNGVVQHLSNASDAELNWLYRNCMFTVFPSLFEGWGLPVAESLAFGKWCITSQGSSTEEVAPELSDILDPYDLVAWVNRITLYLDNPALLRRLETRIVKEFRVPSWADSISTVHPLLQPTYLPNLRFRELIHEKVVSFHRKSRDLSNYLYLGRNFSQPEVDGAWLMADNGELHIPVLSTKTVIRAVFSALCPFDENKTELSIYHNGAEVLKKTIYAATTIDIPVGKIAVRSETEITLKLCANRADRPADLGFGKDERRLSVKLHSLAIAQDGPRLDILSPNIERTERPCVQTPVSGRELKHFESFNEQLALIENALMLPDRLPPTRLFFRVLRVLRLDRLALRFYGRIFARTTNSLRSLVEIIKHSRS